MMKSIQSNSYGKEETTSEQIKTIKNEIKNEVINNYSSITYAINDGINENNKFTIGINIDFENETDATNLNNWLIQKYEENSSILEFARIRMYNSNTSQLPELGNIWTL